MKVLYIAEIVGKAGIACCKKALSQTRRNYNADLVIACADGATGGNGLGRNHAAYLRKLGADVLTCGECCFYKKDLTETFDKLPYVLRPDNLVTEAPGMGWHISKTKPAGTKIAVTMLLGQTHFNKTHANNPFHRLSGLLERLRAETPCIIIDFHAEATAEKQGLFALAAGKVSAVIGSHTRIQTADEQIRDGTAFISCAGRTGSIDSVGGCDATSRINEYLSGIPDWTYPAWENCQLQGVIIELDDHTGRARSIERLHIPIPLTPPTDSDVDAE